MIGRNIDLCVRDVAAPRVFDPHSDAPVASAGALNGDLFNQGAPHVDNVVVSGGVVWGRGQSRGGTREALETGVGSPVTAGHDLNVIGVADGQAIKLEAAALI